MLAHPSGRYRLKQQPLLFNLTRKRLYKKFLLCLLSVQNFCFPITRSKFFIPFPLPPVDPPRPPRPMVRTDASQILLDSSSTLPLRKKSPNHIAAVSQDERMMLVADAGALPGFRLLVWPTSGLSRSHLFGEEECCH